MKFITNIKRKFSKWFKHNEIPAKDIWSDSEYVINYAFTCGGVDYYCFDDLGNKPFERALQCVTFYTELGENCTKEVMKEFHTALGKCFIGNKIDISQVIKIHSVLGDRLYKLPPAPSIIKRIASVVYFDKNEKPTKYDYDYNLKKIKHWEKHLPNDDFFLFQPIKKLIPYLNESDVNISNYLKVWNELENMTLENLLQPQSQKVNNKEANKVEA